MRYKAVLFDLFRTLILFDEKAPTMKAMEPSWRSAMEALREPASRRIPGLPFDAFLDALAEVTNEIARALTAEHFEVPAFRRYLQALHRVGLRPSDGEQLARELAGMQMAELAAHAHFPAAHGDLLRDLHRTHRLAVVSNFDDGPVIHRLLEREGIAGLFRVTLISVEFGRRKPHRAIFDAALRALEVSAREALFVGDSLVDDVAGARGAGIDVAWIDAGGTSPATAPRPTYVVRRLEEVRDLV